MLSLNDPVLVFTDLDGTLLDNQTYDWQPAAGWLARLREHEIPVILCSSKTAAEMLYIQKSLNLHGLPLIAENGAVIEYDSRWQTESDSPRLMRGVPHDEVSAVLNKLREKGQYKFTTFDDVDEATISEWTGLPHAQASLSRLHEASVTLIWRDSDARMAAFSQQLNALGLQFVHGARFWHVLDASAGKDQAANGLIARYQRQWGQRPVTVGLGDGPNDAPLLKVMNYAVVVKGLSREGVVLPDQASPYVYRTRSEGPAGWSEGMSHLFTPD
ncbi:TPA: mannosyl-3-phosphoglycerate phosphatase-related protein [Citrobacter sedlakii]